MANTHTLPQGVWDWRTGALLEQKLRSLDSVDSFIYERLYEGCLLRADDTWQPEGYVVRQLLYDEYLTVADKVGVKRRAEMNQFGRALKKLIPSIQETRPRDVVGRKRAYAFPDLAEARALFETAVGQAVDWPDDGFGPGDRAGEGAGWR